MMDSGGFSLGSGQYPTLTIDELVTIYSSLGADLYATLDLPPNAKDNNRRRAQKWHVTLSNLDRMLCLFGDKNLVPVIHGHTLDEIAAACRAVQERIRQPAVIALGGMVPFIRGHITKQFRYKRANGSIGSGDAFVADAISICKKELPLSHLHVFGAGSTTTAIALLVFGADTVNSLAWRRAAGFGTIFLPGLAERIVSRKVRARYSRPRITATHREALEECGCPVCAQHSRFAGRVRTLSQSYEARAVHNVWTLRMEEVAFQAAIQSNSLGAFSTSQNQRKAPFR